MQRWIIKVKPGSKTQKVMQAEDGSWVIHLKSPPVDGKANAELIHLLAKTFRVCTDKIRIKTGQASRFKIVEVED